MSNMVRGCLSDQHPHRTRPMNTRRQRLLSHRRRLYRIAQDEPSFPTPTSNVVSSLTFLRLALAPFGPLVFVSILWIVQSFHKGVAFLMLLFCLNYASTNKDPPRRLLMAKDSPSPTPKGQKSKSLNVVVRGVGQRDTMLTLAPWDTVGYVFQELRRQRLIPQFSRVRHVLYFDQHRHGPLEEDEVLEDIGVCSLSVLHLRASVPGGTRSGDIGIYVNDSNICSASKPSGTARPSIALSEPGGRSRFLCALKGVEFEFWLEKLGKYLAVSGGASDIWKAELTKDDGSNDTIQVALKYQRPIDIGGESSYQRFGREVRYWKRLDHDYVAPLYGIHLEADQPPAIVLPWYKNGNADAYLRTHPDVNPIRIIYELSLAVEHLHSMGVIHGDLKAANIMIDDDGHVKLIDFGASQLDTDIRPTPIMLSIRWCPREVLVADAPITKTSDVYSFASTVLELLTGRVPYDTLLADRLIPLKIMEGVTPRHLSSDPRYEIAHSEELWVLLERCWAESTSRPSMSEVRLCLQTLYC